MFLQTSVKVEFKSACLLHKYQEDVWMDAGLAALIFALPPGESKHASCSLGDWMDRISGLYLSYKGKSLLVLGVEPRYLDHAVHGLVTVLNYLSYSSL